jgi:hemophore-related protein
VAAVGAAGMLAFASAGLAGAEPAPDQCSPAAMMRAHSGAMTQMADYLDSHPDVQRVFTDARGQATPQARHDMIMAYFDTHPDVAAAVRNIHQPVRDLRASCGLPMQPGMHGGMGLGPMGLGPMEDGQ